MGNISKENRREFALEKRVKELTRMGYRPDNIHAMMYSPKSSEKFTEKQIRKMARKVSPDIKLDGKV